MFTITDIRRCPSDTRDKRPYRPWDCLVCAVDRSSCDLWSGPRSPLLLLLPAPRPLPPRRKPRRAKSDVTDLWNRRSSILPEASRCLWSIRARMCSMIRFPPLGWCAQSSCSVVWVLVRPLWPRSCLGPGTNSCLTANILWRLSRGLWTGLAWCRLPLCLHPNTIWATFRLEKQLITYFRHSIP